MSFKKVIELLFVSLLFFGQFAFAQQTNLNEVFQLSAIYKNNNQVELNWEIKKGYHLYKNNFHIASLDKNLNIATINFPKGKTVHDNILGTYDVYEKQIALPIIINNAPSQYELSINYQGCQDEGSCFPPQTKYLYVNNATRQIEIFNTLKSKDSTQAFHQKYDQLLSDNILFGLLIFFGIGILLAFTPCVLPMIPILSSIIVGSAEKNKSSKAFKLSLVYVLSMAVTYALIGAVFSLLGKNLQVVLQNEIVLILFALLFLILAFSLFGFYELQLPQWLRSRASHISHEQRSGTYLGAAMMGALSILILSPCVTPPLIGALMYIAHTGNLFYGSLALFFMGLGMGLPLIFIGMLGGKLLPKAGYWMNAVKYLFGFILLGMALWIIMRILPASVMMLAWGVYAFSVGLFFLLYNFAKHIYAKYLIKVLAALILLYGILIVVGAALGNDDPLSPLNSKRIDILIAYKIKVIDVKNVNELNNALAQAKAKQVPVMLDYYAAWCITCREIEGTILSSHRILSELENFWIIRVDMTEDSNQVEQLKQAELVYAPPVLIFYDRQGNKVQNKTITGPVSEVQLYQALMSIN